MTIHQAKQVVTALEGELTAKTNELTALQTIRRRLSFSAYNGDAGDHKKLIEATAASTTAQFELENIRSALDVARQKVTEAEREVDVEKRSEVARQAKGIIAEAEQYSGAMSDGLDQLCDGLAAFSSCLDRLERLDYPVSRGRLRLLAYTRAVQERLRQAGLDFGIVSPHLRHSLPDLNENYLRPSRDLVARDLGETVADAAEAA
jgi:hypothetical protein